MLSFLLATGLGGCSLCQRVSAMSPAERAQFYTVLGVVFAALVVGYALYRLVRAPLLPRIVTPHCQWPVIGMLVPLQRNFHRFSAWRTEVTKETFEQIRQKQMHQLMLAGRDGADIDKLPTPALMQWSLPLQPSPFVEVLTAPGLKFLLGDGFTSFNKGQVLHDVFEEMLGSGIFRADGESWRQQRKVASHLFSFSKLNDYMFTVFTNECDKLVAYLAGVARSGETIDFQRAMFDLTFDSICDIAFGVKMHQLGAKSAHPFCVAFDELQHLIMARSVTAPLWWKTKRRWGLGDEKIFKQHVATINEFIAGIVQERRKHPDEFNTDDLLSLFLQDAQKRGEELTDEHLRDLILNFMIAGRDTTATALTWLFYAFAQNPSAEAVCVREIRENLSPSVQPSSDAVKGLVQLEAAFMESTRLWPPVPSDMKECVKEVQAWPGTNALVPVGTVLIYTPYMLHRLPQFYKSTSGLQHWAADCTEFRPARWLVPDGDSASSLRVLQPSAYDFPSFNAGLRLCLGRSMAILEGKIVAASVLQQFHIRLQPGFEPKEKVTVVLAMRDGMPVTVEMRK